MKKAALTRNEKMIVVVAALLVGALFTLLMTLYVNRDNRWLRIVSPKDQRAIEIVAVTRLLQPYVKTDAGNYFFCSGGEWTDSCRPVSAGDLPVNKIPGRWQTCAPQLPALPPLPAAAVSTLDVGQCQEGRTYARLAILEDGTIWKWQRTFSWVNGFATVSAAAWGLTLGALAGWGIVRLRRYLREPVPTIPHIVIPGAGDTRKH